MNGEVQAANGPPSTRHSKVPGSVEPRSKVGVLSAIALPFAGPPVIDVSGGVMSTVKVRDSGVGSALPWRSRARTAKVCVASVSGPIVSGDAHAAKAPPSIEHWKLPLGLSFAEDESGRRVVGEAPVARAAVDRRLGQHRL